MVGDRLSITVVISMADNTSPGGDGLENTDRAILDVLEDGRATEGYLIEETGCSPTEIEKRLNVLEEAGYVREVHPPTALVELVNDPRTPD